MRNSILIITTAAALLAAQPALAQDGGARDDSDASRSFTGLRAEATIGYDEASNARLQGMRIGAAIGYDVAIGESLTLGVEAGTGVSVAGERSLVYSVAPGQTYTLNISAKQDIDVSARLGAKLSRHTLLFAKAGWAYADYRYNSSQPSEDEAYAYDTNGVLLGAGLEQKLGKRFYAKAEYRYTHYGDDGADRHQFLTGIGLRF